jgi:hypothetical protein
MTTPTGTPKPANGTNTGGGIGTNTGGGTSTGTQTQTTTGGGGTTETAPAPAWKEYFDKATQMEFSYNPAEDQEYLRAASQIEQQVTDMMVGRGGLYSSVAHSALQNRLMSLQVDYQKQAYEKYLEERNYNLQLASFMADREDTAFEQQMAVDKFKAELDQQKFENSIASAQLRIQQANAAYNRQASGARTQQTAANNQLAFMQADYQVAAAEYEKMVQRWRDNDGVADALVADYFDVYAGSSFDNYQNRLYTKQQQLQAQANQIAAYAKQVGDAETYLNALNGFQQEATAGANYSDAYSSAYSTIINMSQSGESWQDIASYVTGKSGDFINAMGTTNYNKLLDYIDKKLS